MADGSNIHRCRSSRHLHLGLLVVGADVGSCSSHGIFHRVWGVLHQGSHPHGFRHRLLGLRLIAADQDLPGLNGLEQLALLQGEAWNPFDPSTFIRMERARPSTLCVRRLNSTVESSWAVSQFVRAHCILGGFKHAAIGVHGPTDGHSSWPQRPTPASPPLSR